MIVEIPTECFARIQPVLSKYGFQNHPIMQSIVQGFNRGKIYADSLEQPSVVLIWAYHEIFFLIGDSCNEIFNASLPDAICQKIAPVAAAIQDDSFQLEVYPNKAWRTRIEPLLTTFSPKRYYRWSFRFNEERYPHQTDWRSYIPLGYEMRKIDYSVLAQDSEHRIEQEIRKFWSSTDAFLQHGLGYCILHQGTVVTCCISAFVCNGHFEIGINTFDNEHRGKGLATLTARAFIEWCLANQITPHWSTESFRLDSIAIAEKLGFERLNFYCCYYFPFSNTIGLCNT